MWRSGSSGPVNYSIQPGIHIWATTPISFGSGVITDGKGREVTLTRGAAYNKNNLPPANSAADGNANNAVRDSLTAQGANNKYYFPAAYTSQNADSEIPSTTTVYWFPFPPATKVENRVLPNGQIVTVTVPNKP